ncbi:hypothetical protein [Micromonospora sp. WMMD1219]
MGRRTVPPWIGETFWDIVERARSTPPTALLPRPGAGRPGR